MSAPDFRMHLLSVYSQIQVQEQAVLSSLVPIEGPTSAFTTRYLSIYPVISKESAC